MEVWTDREGHHLPDPWPQRTPIHGAAKDGVPIMVKLGRRELRVLRVVSAYDVDKTGAGFLGTAWKLQLEDYRRVVVFHSEHRGWLLAR
jgi:hypothetical protein